MESIFQLFFNETLNASGNTQVCCPFPHAQSDGSVHYDTRPSAGVNVDKGVFNCFTCGSPLSEVGFIQKKMNISYLDAVIVKDILLNAQETEIDWEPVYNNLTGDWLDTLYNLGISDTVRQTLRIGFEGRSGLSFPVFLFGKIVNVATYRPNTHPKTLYRKGSKAGMIIPFDLWREDKRPTLICAGEKDMAIARTLGFNAINVTGGEGTMPQRFFMNYFKDRSVYIIYDNDKAGYEGSMKLAMNVRKYTDNVHVVDLSSICVNEGEDLWDYVMKYGKNKDDLIALLQSTEKFTDEQYEKEIEKEYPTLPLIEAGNHKYIGKIVRSNIQVTSTLDTSFKLDTAFVATKTKVIDDKCTMRQNEERLWTLNEFNLKDMLYLIDSKLTEKKILKHKRELTNIPDKEQNVSISTRAKEQAFKCTVTDVYDPDMESTARKEVVAYSIGKRLENGYKYRLTYKLVPHPFDGQKLTMIVLDVEEVDDSITNFKLTPEKIEQLKLFQPSEHQTVSDKIDESIDKIKNMMAFEYHDDLVKLEDFFFHTALSFNLGKKIKNERGTLDVLLVGESRTGKSDTAETLMELYGVGQKVSMPNATSASLIGGSNRDSSGTYTTKIGTLSRNHKGLLVLEELGKAKAEGIMKELTEIKSSGMIRLGRVDATITTPAVVRMINITNTKNKTNGSQPISSYPNGISVVVELVDAAEDIARFDLVAVFSKMVTEDIDFGFDDDLFDDYAEPYPVEAYRTRIRWIWSRSADQIIIPRETAKVLQDYSNKLKNKYKAHIQLFGSETWKKMLRLAIAIAGYVASTDETFENIVVTPEHIAYAANFMKDLYDNPTFRFREYCYQENLYNEIDEEATDRLQHLYFAHSTLLLELENVSETSRNNLASIAGLPQEAFSKLMNTLVQLKFIQYVGNSIRPTQRFRKGMKLITRSNTSVKKVGEREFVTNKVVYETD